MEPGLLESLRLDENTFKETWASYEKYILTLSDAGDEHPEAKALQEAIKNGSEKSIDARLRYAFYGHVIGSQFTIAELQNQRALADLRYPSEWYATTREVKRTVHLHVGPTNSGKTYHALKRLEQAETGVYAGPLRLLAHEIYTRMNAIGKPCSLVTGEERRLSEGEQKLWSCTVEMTPVNTEVEVAVIDEIQMINNHERGWAWTQAFLGVRAKEVHLCGEERTVPLIQEMTAAIGDKLIIHKYERLSPLKMMAKSLEGDLNKLEKGDCVVSFSVMGIHALRKQIEKNTGRKVAIIYGSLPPETRAQQARLFNDPDNDYDFLVASDAIGMGLNLSIKRVIFESSQKNNGHKTVPLMISEVKQIGGRAGRYRTAEQSSKEATESNQAAESNTAQQTPSTSNGQTDAASAVLARLGPVPSKPVSKDPGTVGFVTTLEKFDFPSISFAMKTQAEPILTAGLFPPNNVIERFVSYFPPGTPFSYILLRLNEISRIHPRFHLCGLKDQLVISDAIQTVKGLTTNDRIIFCAAPCQTRNPKLLKLVRTLAECVGMRKNGELLNIPDFDLELLEREPSADRNYLGQLETLHKGLVLYLWLSFRFSGVFTTRALATHVKELVEDAIAHTLGRFSFTEDKRKKLAEKRQRLMIQSLKEDIMKGNGEGMLKGIQEIGEEEEVKDPDDESMISLKSLAEQDAHHNTGYDIGKSTNYCQDPEPDAVHDILTDTASFAEPESGPRDDYDEYPMPELENDCHSSRFAPFESLREIENMVDAIVVHNILLEKEVVKMWAEMGTAIELGEGLVKRSESVELSVEDLDKTTAQSAGL
ncbi:P-loop containing nucleoside triphosphate hydrolase protein [Lepidopterella palustris CBS 459.81]|uniref:RNA helicase n=1 Tax=Lepidopterella palustris CBS 459.81 TaxID=1314670 RepID=A0A8E2EA97_9PEZI|nr:P-loop containing nucleoside triphosphate hydrolase protein [Lepidopterella palustris CBS 459.81]